MYSGIPITNNSGTVFGVHQKIDRVAHRALEQSTNIKNFPSNRQVLHFEGRNGPDGIKVKSPAQDEPWHYIDPFDPTDTQLLQQMREHHDNLVKELKAGNMERAGFEASWLAHAIVDGLTPAHHYPYEEELIELRKGEGKETRTSAKEKLLMKGDTATELAKNNWRMWGFKGLIVSHVAFEAGIAAIISPFRFRQVQINKSLLNELDDVGFEEYFLRRLRKVGLLKMFERFSRFGWTWTLSKEVRDDLVPLIAEVVAMSWYSAMREAGLTTRLKS